MSISLKNHEDRIYNLEHHNHRWVKLWGTGSMLQSATTLNLAESIRNFDIVIVEYGCCNYTNASLIDLKETWLWCNNIKFNDVDTGDNAINDYAFCSHPDGHGIKTMYFRSNGTQIYVSNFALSGGLLGIYGLKLYYSFSYNIIYKATHLLEKIFYVLNKGGVSL